LDPQPETRPLSKAALLGLIFNVVGICLFPFTLAGIILAIVGLVKTSSNKNLRGMELAIVALALVPVPLITGTLAAIAIPNFIKFQSRSKQAECKSNLKSFFTAEKSYYQEHDAYSASVREVSFSPERGNRYAYFAASAGTIEDRTGSGSPHSSGNDVGVGVDLFKYPSMRQVTARDLPPSLAGDAVLGMVGKCPDCQITLACAGQIDHDETLDVWSVSTTVRRGPGGEEIPAGIPFNDINDLEK
jgi:Tfp pilus assembly protein PilE